MATKPCFSQRSMRPGGGLNRSSHCDETTCGESRPAICRIVRRPQIDLNASPRAHTRRHTLRAGSAGRVREDAPPGAGSTFIPNYALLVDKSLYISRNYSERANRTGFGTNATGSGRDRPFLDGSRGGLPSNPPRRVHGCESGTWQSRQPGRLTPAVRQGALRRTASVSWPRLHHANIPLRVH